MDRKRIVLCSVLTLVVSVASARAESPGAPIPGMPTLQDGLRMLGVPVPEPTPQPPAATPAAAPAGEAHTLVTATIAEGANIWLPSTLIIKSGTSVKVTLKNVSKIEHGFGIDALGIKQTLPAGATAEVRLAPTASGLLRYYCPLHPGHIGGQILVQ